MRRWFSEKFHNSQDVNGFAIALADHLHWALLTLGLAALSACTTVVPLKVSTEFLPPSPIQVPLTVGVYHSPELRTYQNSGDPTVSQRFVFPVGEATVRLLDGLYPTLFAKTVAVDKPPPLPPSDPPVAAVVEVSIETFNIEAGPFIGENNFSWAVIVYRITVYSPSGPVLASWKVRGIGERSGPRDGRLFADAVELAMRDAAEKLQMSFFNVPEARRWIRKLPTKGVNAPTEAQTTSKEGQTVWISFPGVAAATAEVARDPHASRVLTAKVRVRNEGSGRLFVRPFDFELALHSGTTAQPAPPSALVAAAASAYFRVPPLGYAPGFTFGGTQGFAIGTLVSVLINLAAEKAEYRQIEAVITRFRTEAMRDITLWQGDSIEFVTNFVVSPEAGMPQTLSVPLIDLDTATRYLIRLPVQ